jgi:hypothetical protein
MSRWIVAVSLLALASPACLAQRTYAVLSLVGDRIEVVRRAPVTGSSIDRNQRETIPVPDGSIDRAILAAADRALRAADPTAKPVLLLASDPGLYEAQARMLDENGVVTWLLEPMRGLLKDSHVTHLILFSKYRHEARFQLGHARVGNGMIEGAGFYLDYELMTRRGDTQERARGFLASFVYFQLTVIDLASASIVRQESRLGSNLLSAARSESGNPWETLSSAQKIDALVRISRREVSSAIPELIRAP